MVPLVQQSICPTVWGVHCTASFSTTEQNFWQN